MKHLLWAMSLAALSACDARIAAENSLPTDAEANANPSATLLYQLQGAWISDDDPQNVMSIIGNKVSTVYDGQPLGDEKIVIVQDCSKMLADRNGKSFTLDDGGPDLRCFNILSVSENNLVYSYMPRGNTLSFSRLRG